MSRKVFANRRIAWRLFPTRDLWAESERESTDAVIENLRRHYDREDVDSLDIALPRISGGVFKRRLSAFQAE